MVETLLISRTPPKVNKKHSQKLHSQKPKEQKQPQYLTTKTIYLYNGILAVGRTQHICNKQTLP